MTQSLLSTVERCSQKDEHKCRYCKKVFATKQQMAAHIKNCSVHKEYVKDLDSYIC